MSIVIHRSKKFGSRKGIMKCPKCGKEMRTTSNITLSPRVKVSPDYWECMDRKNCRYEMPKRIRISG